MNEVPACPRGAAEGGQGEPYQAWYTPRPFAGAQGKLRGND
jgi:hypothetical protein